MFYNITVAVLFRMNTFIFLYRYRMYILIFNLPVFSLILCYQKVIPYQLLTTAREDMWQPNKTHRTENKKEPLISKIIHNQNYIL